MNDDSIDALLVAHAANQQATSNIGNTGFDAWSMMHSRMMMESRERERQLDAVEQFKQSYIKIRTDNIVLDHQSAIELTKMIFKEAATLTYEDTLW